MPHSFDTFLVPALAERSVVVVDLVLVAEVVQEAKETRYIVSVVE
jgi:hypothetical protein